MGRAITIRNLGSHRRRRLRRAIYKRDCGRCRYCAKALAIEQMTLDHVHPHADGGATAKRNLVSACFDCNHNKENKIIEPLPLEHILGLMPVMMEL